MTKNENFQFNTLHIYLMMNYEELLNNWRQNRKKQKTPFKIVCNNATAFSNCISCDSSIVRTTYGERVDTGWNNMNFESTLSKEWCPIEFKNFAFNEDLQSFVDKNVSHFSRAFYANLL